jgi:hypothetical protein
VPDEVWAAAKARQQHTRHAVRTAGVIGVAKRPQYLFSGLTKCGICGAGFIMSGKNRLGCFGARDQGRCDNHLTIRRDEVEELDRYTPDASWLSDLSFPFDAGLARNALLNGLSFFDWDLTYDDQGAVTAVTPISRIAMGSGTSAAARFRRSVRASTARFSSFEPDARDKKGRPGRCGRRRSGLGMTSVPFAGVDFSASVLIQLPCVGGSQRCG